MDEENRNLVLSVVNTDNAVHTFMSFKYEFFLATKLQNSLSEINYQKYPDHHAKGKNIFLIEHFPQTSSSLFGG